MVCQCKCIERHMQSKRSVLEDDETRGRSVFLILILMVCSTKPLLGHHALVRVVGFRMAGFMLSGSGIRVCVLGNVELGWGGWGKVQFNVGG